MHFSRACILAVLFTVGLFSTISAQSISMDNDPIIWRLSKMRNTLNDSSSPTKDWFKSSPDSIWWVWDQGRTSERMHIDSKYQTWLDINEDGFESFQVMWRKIPGTITFRRKNGESSIITEFVKDNVNIAPYEYSVSDVTKD